MGLRRWQARSAGAQRPLSLRTAAWRAGSRRSGAGWLGWRAPRAAAQSPPTTLAEQSTGGAHGAVRASSGHRRLQSLGGGLGSRGQTLHSTQAGEKTPLDARRAAQSTLPWRSAPAWGCLEVTSMGRRVPGDSLAYVGSVHSLDYQMRGSGLALQAAKPLPGFPIFQAETNQHP